MEKTTTLLAVMAAATMMMASVAHAAPTGHLIEGIAAGISPALAESDRSQTDPEAEQE